MYTVTYWDGSGGGGGSGVSGGGGVDRYIWECTDYLNDRKNMLGTKIRGKSFTNAFHLLMALC